MITLRNINISHVLYPRIDLAGIRLGVGGGGRGQTSPIPGLEGVLGLYSGKGLTNEQMSANPVWKDKSGLGNDLQMKNFLWKLGSGCGSYKEDYAPWYINSGRAIGTKSDSMINITSITSPVIQTYTYPYNSNKYEIPPCNVRITGLEGSQSIAYRTQYNIILEIASDGVYTLPSYIMNDGSNDGSYYGFQFTKTQKECNITIEQIPDYSGAIVFDGVDDYGICETFPILTKEKGYTVMVLRKYITANLAYLAYNGNKASKTAFAFERSDSVDTWSWGKNSLIRNLLPSLFSYQTSDSYNNHPISTSTVLEGSNSITVAKTVGNYANVALYSLVIIDHDTTEEERQLVIDYWKKEFPWLFFDQAWTVTGKTNEDSDRATIANLTDNGNNLVLSNFGFAGNSGYGLYVTDFTSWTNGSATGITYKSFSTSACNGDTSVFQHNRNGSVFKAKVTGITGQNCRLEFGSGTIAQSSNSILTDGTYEFRDEGTTGVRGFKIYDLDDPTTTRTLNNPITIEQIPEYEGYLITDGVDDKAISTKSIPFTDKWTIVTETVFLGETSTASGIIVPNVFFLYNYQKSNEINIGIGSSDYSVLKITASSIKAFSSDGVIYDADWNQYHAGPEVISTLKSLLKIGTSSDEKSQFCQAAFKNLGIYNNRILSKEQCIQAYNYLQILKNK